MSAYNKVNGAWCSENPRLLTDILKEEWGFRGFVVSDWGAVHSTIPTANAGLDVEMPKGVFLNKETLLPAISAGTVQGRTIDDKIRRLLRVIVWTGILDGAAKDTGALDRPDHRQIALQTAREGVVLLKNAGGTLPLDPARIRSIAVIGPNAATARTGGGGSSQVNPLYAVSTLDAVRKRTGTAIAVRYAAGCRSEGEMDPIPSSALQPPGSPAGMHGLKAEYFANANLEGAPVLTRVDPQVDFDWSDGSPGAAVPVDNFSGRWSGTLVAPITGNYTLSVSSDDGVRLFLDGKAVIEHWSDHATETRSVTLPLTAGQVVGVVLEYYEHAGGANLRFGWRTGDEKLHDEAIAAARGADVVLLCIGTGPQLESEGFDRKSLTLPDDQIALVKGVVEANPRTIVVLNSGAPLLMDGWLDRVPALLEAWFPGEEGGTAVAEVLFGDSNPSGKLPMTFPARWEDAPAYGNFPGKGSVDYAEGIFIGYRHFDRKNLDVLFPFGHGLSYTSFAYGPLAVTTPGKAEGASATVAVEVTNTGARAGDEVVQLYVHDREASVERPTRELKGFRRVALAPGETKRVTFSLDARAFAYYSVREKRWEVEPGTFEILVGSSSRDIRSREVLTLQ
jgi:beta-glucosidase